MGLKERKEIDITLPAFKDDEIMTKDVHKFMDRVIANNGKKTKKGSQDYMAAGKVIIRLYAKSLISVMVNLLLRGDKVIFYKHGFTAHLTPLPTYRKINGKGYEYYRGLKGVYPIIRVAMNPFFIIPIAIRQRIDNKALRIDATYTQRFSKMVTHEITKNNRQYSEEWRTLIKFNK